MLFVLTKAVPNLILKYHLKVCSTHPWFLSIFFLSVNEFKGAGKFLGNPDQLILQAELGKS